MNLSMKCIFSIIIPMYNCESTIKRCLQSIVEQNFKDFEVIMINDGSTDMTEEICLSYCNIDKRFKYLYKENGGVASARNFGLSKSNGEYISFVDADDTLNKSFLSIHFNNLQKYDCNISVCAINRINTKNTSDDSTLNKVKIIDYDKFLLGLVNGKGISSGCLNKIYKRSIISNIRFSTVAVAEDLNFNYDIVKNKRESIKVVITNKKLYNYYYNCNSITHGKFSKKNLDILHQYNKIIKDSTKFEDFNKAMKMSLAFMSLKLLAKMISSEFYDKQIYDTCLSNIFLYKNEILKSSEYSFTKKIFLLFFCIFKRNFVTSYNKQNIFKNVCIYINRNVG